MAADWMPPLPEPSDYPDATSYGLACWKQGIEDAAKLCKEEEEDRLWRAYKGRGEPIEKGNPHTEGASDQCAVLADAMMALTKEITP